MSGTKQIDRSSRHVMVRSRVIEWGRAVPEYRIYHVRKDGRIAGPPEAVECPNDEAAVQVAKKRLDDLLIEVWEGGRVVIRLEPE